MRLAVIVLIAGACAATSRTAEWERPGQPFGAVSAEILDHMVASGDAAFAARDKPESLDDAIESWRGALRYRPDDPLLLLRLSRACRLRARTLTHGAAAERARAAVGYAERALAARNESLWNLAHAKKPPHEVFAVAQPPDAPLLAAYAEALLEWSTLYSTATLLNERDSIEAAAVRAVELDRAAGLGAGDRVLGWIKATLSGDLGGDLRAAEVHFEASLAQAPGYLPTRLSYAESYCVRKRDGARYRKLLDEIAAANAEALPEAAPENRAAQKRAQTLLAEAKSW
jgi:TRAP transporter T-component